ncbi:MAG: Crp/Fnr family transcriptional regulator [Anaerolineales bacterium]|nr:Crp/Fnr family transcriptional regulator [Anaerolineales bacterium]
MPTILKNQRAIEELKASLYALADIPEGEWLHLLQQISERRFEKSQYLLQAGDVAENFYFIHQGLVRFFYSTVDGKEFNKHFAMEGQMAGSFQSLVLNAPCGFFIQALEPTKTIVLPNPSLKEYYSRHPCWERIGRKHAEMMFLVKENREKELLLDSLETRYHSFMNEYPGLADRIPQYHIASFLGVTDVALSRVRRKISASSGKLQEE